MPHLVQRLCLLICLLSTSKGTFCLPACCFAGLRPPSCAAACCLSTLCSWGLLTKQEMHICICPQSCCGIKTFSQMHDCCCPPECLSVHLHIECVPLSEKEPCSTAWLTAKWLKGQGELGPNLAPPQASLHQTPDDTVITLLSPPLLALLFPALLFPSLPFPFLTARACLLQGSYLSAALCATSAPCPRTFLK